MTQTDICLHRQLFLIWMNFKLVKYTVVSTVASVWLWFLSSDMGVGEGSGEGKGSALVEGTPDLVNRDPNDINDHLKVSVYHIYILL